MLFDLRGRGRRRTVRVIYGGLALLIGAGLVFFGVGAGVGGGGLLNSLTGKEGSNSASFANQIKKYKKLTQQQPASVYGWEQLTFAQLHEAGGEAYFANQRLTAQGRELFGQTAKSWNSYIALKPPKPNVQLALQMVRVFGEEGLNQPADVVKVLQIVIPAKSESPPQYQASLYTSLAGYAYKAHNPRIGDLASAKALALTPSAQRKQVKTLLAAIKANPNGTEAATSGGQAAGGAKGATNTTIPTKTGSSPTTTKK
ncbi:MAG TPA: hypothetical protein VNY35_04805 [Solirubrobacteraceae bacterium]|jgi:hypothetical protein|nr:hypothetical protein [Solirubrobacteraceae bacterium]